MKLTATDRTHAVDASRGRRGTVAAGADGMVWRDASTESIGRVRDMTVVGADFHDNEDGTGVLTIGGGGGGGSGSGSGGGVGTSAGSAVRVLNNSGGDLNVGDVVVTDDTADNAVTTTTTEGDTRIAGVVQEAIADGFFGLVLFNGYAAQVNAPDAVRGEYAKTSTTAGEATSTADRESGSFAVYMTGADLPDFATDAVTTTSDTLVTTLDIDIPVAPVDRLLFLGLWLESTTSAIDIPNWTLIGSTAGFYYFYRVATGSDAAVATWTVASTAVASVLLLHSTVSLAVPIEDFAYEATTSAAALSGLSDVPRFAIAGVDADVTTPGSGFTRFGGGSASNTGVTPTLVQAKSNANFSTASITLDSPVTVGNVLVAVIVDRASATPTMSAGGWTLLTSSHADAAVDGGPPAGSYQAIYARVATGTTQAWSASGTAFRWRLYEIADTSIAAASVLATTNYSPGGTSATLDLGDYASALGVALMVQGETRGNASANHKTGSWTEASGWTERLDTMIDPSQLFNDHIVMLADASPSGSTLDVAATYTDGDAGQTIGRMGGCAVLFGVTAHEAAGTLAGKYIDHDAAVTSPFSGVDKEGDAIFAVNLLRDAMPAAILYGPDLFGSEAVLTSEPLILEDGTIAILENGHAAMSEPY